MAENNALELVGITKSFTIEVEDTEKKGILNKNPTKKITNLVLDNITINIKKGETLGVLGRNGSGKSTFLSIIARILEPDSGTIVRNGKIASILELGMGFHPDMSGRENIYLKGELYGFSRKEIDKKIDTIIEYSGISKYIDNPIRTYSSGMTGRLAFAIMVNVDSDIMLVDEVLSVGDTSFELKAREHFKKLAQSGKTILFVSHNINFIESVCNRAIWIESGKIIRDGPAKLVCSEYQNKMSESPEIIEDLAMAGVPDAQYKLALMYRDGKEFGQNDTLYTEWIKRAANSGHTRAQVEYADFLMSEGNTSEATRLYQFAANKGDNDAKLKISTLFSENDSDRQELLDVYKKMACQNDCIYEYRYADLLLKTAWNNTDRKNAFDMFLKSSNDGYPNAHYQVAIMYRDGVGAQRDVEKMKLYLEKAVECGVINAIMLLADLYSQGKLLPKDEEQSFELYLKAAELGNATAMYKTATNYKNGIGTGHNNDLANKWFQKYSHQPLLQFQIWAADYINANPDSYDTCSISLYKKAAEMNNVVAISSMITHSVKNREDTEKYIHSLRKIAESNNLDAMRRMGNFYYDGVGVKKDYSEAAKWYEKCSAIGDSWSRNRLGEMYRDGKGVPTDYDKAAHLFIASAKRNNVLAANNAILLYVTGQTGDRSTYESAMKIMESIAESNNIDAMRRMGNFYYSGVGVKKDYSEAAKWYEKCSAIGDSWSRNRLGEMYRDGKGGLIQDLEKSKHLFLLASKQGNVSSILNLISMITSKQIDDEYYGELITLLENIANAGNIESIKRLGNYHYDGVGVPKDYKQALEWYEKSSKLGDSWSKQRLAEMYRDGKGTDIDIDKAIQNFTELL